MAPHVYTVSLGFGHSRPNTPQHWVLITYPVGSFTCTYYHTTRSGSGGKGPYTSSVEGNKRVDSCAFACMRKICYIPEVMLGEVIEAASEAKPVLSQRYVLDVLRRLEDRDVIPGGTVKRFERSCAMPVIEEE
ncbi:hypothetical protein BJY00DRAFT_313183 [Aspergillus carlsbadensis]|nr:hypothetical protein BJY00DRAFT_313183 [Aspergillus carlsbadensis]